jgi:hypothetical protein
MLRFGSSCGTRRARFYDKSTQFVSSAKQFDGGRLGVLSIAPIYASGTPMTGNAKQISEDIDRPTSLSICRAIGERLRQNLRPDDSDLPSGLRNLMDELRRQDRRY